MLRSKKRLSSLLAAIMMMFLGLVLYLTYFQLVEADGLRNHPRNMRNWVDETKFGRGRFLDRSGAVIVEREKQADGSYVRYSNHPNMYSHIIGYNSEKYGKTGLEARYNNYLLNLQGDNPIAKWRGQILSEGIGNDVRLTIDNELQHRAYMALESHRGAAVALDAQTGKVLAMVSLPSFNVNRLEQNWNELIDDENGVLLNRATQGLYEPGSTMKPITAVSLLDSGIDLSYVDEGKTTINGFTYSNYREKAYGAIELREALIHSSNVYFADKSQLVSPTALQQKAEAFYFNNKVTLDIPTEISRINFTDGVDKTTVAANSFGQGNALVSPLNMAMAYQAIANGGRMLRPTLVDAIISPSGHVNELPSGETLSTPMTARQSALLREYLAEVVSENDLEAGISGVQVAGKTGTAETGKEAHSWFVGFAPAENPQIVIAVVLEHDGRTGAEGAAPIAGRLFDFWFNERRTD